MLSSIDIKEVDCTMYYSAFSNLFLQLFAHRDRHLDRVIPYPACRFRFVEVRFLMR